MSHNLGLILRNLGPTGPLIRIPTIRRAANFCYADKASSTAAVRPGFAKNSNKRELSGQVLRNKATNESRPA